MSESAKRILLVRHGATTATRRACFVGATDTPLNAEGRRQAHDLTNMTTEFAPGACYTSPLRRCRQTADLMLASRNCCQITELPGLREMDFGNWEGKTYSEIAAADPTGLDRMMKMDRTFAPDRGEKVGAFLGRVRRTLRAILADPGERLLVVTHGGVIRAALCILLVINPRKHFHSFEIAPGGSAELLAFDGGAVLRRLTPEPRGKEGAL